MAYKDLSTTMLYHAMTDYWLPRAPNASEGRACAWVEAAYTFAIRSVLQRWFELIEAGTAEDRRPDPFWTCPAGKKPLTQELADLLIAELDADFYVEQGRFDHMNKLAGPDFLRLTPSARLALCQELYGLLRTDEEIMAEARARLQAGELVPPPDKTP